MSYYKTNDPTALAAIAAVNEAFGQLQDKAAAFKTAIGAKAGIFSHGATSIRIDGFVFEPAKSSKFWTKPDRKTKAQSPRLKATGLTQEEKIEHKALLQRWKDGYPGQRVDIRPIYEAIGSDWGNCLFNGIGYFSGVDGFFYASTSANLGAHMVEIVQSEYQAAKDNRPSKYEETAQ